MPSTSTAQLVQRGELLERCVALPAGGLVLLEAPAGYAKTTTLRQLASLVRRRRGTPAWVDNRLPAASSLEWTRRLLAALTAASVNRLPKLPTAQSWSAHAAPIAFVTALCECIAAARERILLLIDNYHAVSNPEIDAALGSLLEQPPPNLLVAIASRRVCHVPVSKALLEDRLVRLDRRDLQFTSAETADFLQRPLSPANLSQLMHLTEGWPGALKIAKVCDSERPGALAQIESRPAFARNFGAYCEFEVLRFTAPEAVDLFTECSIVETLEPQSCDAIRQRQDSARILFEVAAHETYLDAASSRHDSWRLPLLVRHYLQRRSNEHGEATIAARHLRLARFREQGGELSEAIHHYVKAGAAERAAAALEQASPLGVVLAHGDTHGRRLLDAIPPESQRGFPRISAARVYLDFKQGMIDSAGAPIVHARIEGSDVGTRDNRADVSLYRFEASIVDATIDFYRRSLAPIGYVSGLERQFASSGEEHHCVLALAKILVGSLYRVRGDLEAAETAFAQCELIASRNDAGWITTWLRYHSGLIALARGQLDEARYLLHAGLKLWRGSFSDNPTYRAVARIALAEIDYEGGAQGDAKMKLEESVYVAQHIEGWLEPYAALYETAIMIAANGGDFDGAEALLARAAAMPRVAHLFERFLPILRLRLMLMRGHVEEAGRLLEDSALARAWWQNSALDHLSCREWDLLGQCMCRVALLQHRSVDANAIADRLSQVARESGRSRGVAKASALRSMALFQDGEVHAALRALIPALELGQEHGFQRTFLDEAAGLRPILDAVDLGNVEMVPPHVAVYATGLRRSMQGTAPKQRRSTTTGPSAREYDVLRELSAGLSDKLIARKLRLSVPTIKFHVRNIFRKLGVRKRAAAVATAHRLGWL